MIQVMTIFVDLVLVILSDLNTQAIVLFGLIKNNDKMYFM